MEEFHNNSANLVQLVFGFQDWNFYTICLYLLFTKLLKEVTWWTFWNAKPNFLRNIKTQWVSMLSPNKCMIS
jgi:hypothetical protein